MPDFIPAEQIQPDGEARLGSEVVALELKLLRGRRNRDAGEVHRGLGQCIAYASADRYRASALLVVHSAVIQRKRPRGPALGLPLLSTPGTICIASDPPRKVLMANRWHVVLPVERSRR